MATMVSDTRLDPFVEHGFEHLDVEVACGVVWHDLYDNAPFPGLEPPESIRLVLAVADKYPVTDAERD